MRIVRTIVVGALLSFVMLLSGCKRQKPPVPAPQAQAPTITEPAPQPTETKPEEPVSTEPQPTTAPAPEPTAQPPKVSTKTKPKSKPRVSDKTAAKKTPPAQPDKPANKTVIDNTAKADAPQPPLISEPSSQQTIQQRQQTAQLIQATEYNVNNLKRTLSNDEQAIVQHIRSFVEQSKQATKDGDTERAYNLAVRAHLLSDSLNK